jgi:chromosome segregation ATPase
MSSRVDGNIKISTSILNENPHNLNTHEGLVKEYGKLQIQLKQLKILEKRIKKQVDELKDSEVSLLNDIQKFNNLKSLRNEYATKYEEISTALQELKDKKRVTENVVNDAERRNISVKVGFATKIKINKNTLFSLTFNAFTGFFAKQ